MKKYRKTFFILFFVLFILLVFSYFLPLLSYQEAQKAVIVQETYYGNFFIPTYNGEPYFTKPPFYTWISLPFYAIGHAFSSEIFFLRLVSILSYILVGFIIYKLQKKDLFKSLLALFILFTSFRFLSFIYRIDLEPLFIFFVILSFYFLTQFRYTSKVKYIYLFYLFFAFAFLTRGPLHFFLIPSFLFYALIFRDKNILKLLFYFRGWLLFIILVFPWYIFGYLKFGPHIFHEFFYTDILKRLVNKKDPFYSYFEALFLNFAPWILIFLIRIHLFFKKGLFSLSGQSWLYFFAFSLPVFLLSFTGEKFDKYLLYLYPFVALFMSDALLNLYSKKFLLGLGIVLFILNFLAIFIIRFSSLEDLKYRIDLIKANLPKKEKVIFYKQENPLFLFYLKKTVPVIKKEKELLKYYKNGYSFFTTEERKELVPSLVFPDPYKKRKIWYYYKKSTF